MDAGSLTILACVKTGDKYGVKYVNRLASMVARHTTRPYSFLCFTDLPAAPGLDANSVPLTYNLPGWWNKIMLLAPTVRTVYLDLDVVITGNIDFLFDYQGPFCIWKDPWGDKFNSSVMSIGPGFGAEIQTNFMANSDEIMKTFYGDQEYISSIVKHADTWQDVAPGKVKSYKADKLQDGPGEAAVSVFHGNPKPSDFGEGWVKEAWQ